MVSNSIKKALNKSILFSLGRNKFPLAGTKGSLFSIHVKVTFGGSHVWKIEDNDFHQPEIKFILAVMRCCINNLFLQNRAAVARHKRRCFLKDISTRRKICFTSSNKDFLLTLVCHEVLLLERNEKKVISKSIILFHYEESGITWIF